MRARRRRRRQGRRYLFCGRQGHDRPFFVPFQIEIRGGRRRTRRHEPLQRQGRRGRGNRGAARHAGEGRRDGQNRLRRVFRRRKNSCGARRQRRQRQRTVYHGAAARAQFRAERRARFSAYRDSGNESDSGRGACGIPERGKEHAAFEDFGGETEDCQLSFHHAFPQPRRGALLRRYVCGGGYSGAYRGRREGRGAGTRLFKAHRTHAYAVPRGGYFRLRGAQPDRRFQAD